MRDHFSHDVETAAALARYDLDFGPERPDPSEYMDEGRSSDRNICQGCGQPLDHDLPSRDPESAKLGTGGWWHRHCDDADRERRMAERAERSRLIDETRRRNTTAGAR